MSPRDAGVMLDEHLVLIRQYGRAQARASRLIAEQQRELAALRAREIRLRADLIARETALACAREDYARLQGALPGLPRRLALAQRVEALVLRVQDLMRERLHWPAATRDAVAAPLDAAQARVLFVGADTPATGFPLEQADQAIPHEAQSAPVDQEDYAALETGLAAADLVICQTGCLSHGAYWRVQDHCRRTGKPCVMVEQPDALRIIRLHNTQENSAPRKAPRENTR